MISKVNISKTNEYSKNKKIPFFNLTSDCILSAINEIPEFKKRSINKQVFQFDNVNVITPILLEDKPIREIKLSALKYLKILMNGMIIFNIRKKI